MVKEVAAVVPYGYMHPTLAYSLWHLWIIAGAWMCLKSQIYPTCKERNFFYKAGTSWLPFYCVVSFTDTMRVGKKNKQTKIGFCMNDISLFI